MFLVLGVKIFRPLEPEIYRLTHRVRKVEQLKN